ncbi:MAG TPA: bifunctional DNA-formamidopyrimidine glycosylase/DNA-(apurinic or apyrimidinic site) lyase [bacterium]|nr:bifunctional DNA-formamidopyrimidine glycosylase/DNA-(apurinic or apyrimidinic site) lyase [bacterium]
MPELPEVEVLARELHVKICGLRVSRVVMYQHSLRTLPPQGFEAKIHGKKIFSVSRRGKYLEISLEDKTSLWFHLGMTGQLIWSTQPLEDEHLHCRIEFKEALTCLYFRDVRRFGQIYLTHGSSDTWPAALLSLGPDPFKLSNDAFTCLLSRRQGRIKSLLMNQKLLSGLGNIYADECLFRSGIDPRKRARRLTQKRLTRLHRAICETLKEAIQKGGSSIDDFRHLKGEKGSFQDDHSVYGRKGKPCFHCRSLIRRVRLAGRSSHFCPHCQT